MTALTSVETPSKNDVIILVLNDDLAKMVDIIKGLGHLNGGRIAPTIGQ